MRLKRFSLFVAFVLLIATGIAQVKDICVLDLTVKNSEATAGNLFSIEHILKSSGFSYTVTTSMDVAVKSKLIIPSSNIESTTFSQAERDSLTGFISRGGLVIATNVKDALLFPAFGIINTAFNLNRFVLDFKTRYNDTIFKLFDEPTERQVLLGSAADYTAGIGTRLYSITSTDTLAVFGNNEIAIFHNTLQKGNVYVLGMQFKDIILRPQVKEDYKANRSYSNSFEPGQDAFIFMIGGIIKKHFPFIVYKHTAPCNYKSCLIITHDVDATTSIEMFDDYANYERINGIFSTYLITTHYVHDKLAKDFLEGNEDDIFRVGRMGHDMQSHSVAHVPDFDIESVVPIGSPGNTRSNYQPYWDGVRSSNVTVFGEAEVSRDLLQGITGQKVSCFRPGYLAFHNNLIDVLDSLHYSFSSGHSACDVMTNFPFFSHTCLTMSGRLTKVLEISNHISDVFASDPITEENFVHKVDIWKEAYMKVYNNNLSSVLLIHPTRYYKLYAQQLLIRSLPQDAVISNISEFGNYWVNRDETDMNAVVSGDTLNVFLNKKQSQINSMVSFIVSGGKKYNTINVYDLQNTKLPYIKSGWNANDILLHNACQRGNYSTYEITESPVTENVYIYPNPSDKLTAKLHFEIMNELNVSVAVHDAKGRLVCLPVYDKTYNLGFYDIELSLCNLAAGIYFVTAKIGEEDYTLKWINE